MMCVGSGGKLIRSHAQSQRPADLAKQYVAPLRDSLLRLLQDLVRTDTVARPPHGNETPAQALLQKYLYQHGVNAELYEVSFEAASSHDHLVRRDRDYCGRMNLQAVLAGVGNGRSLLLNGHMDTVPPANGSWSASPWSGEMIGDRVYGLGTFDMKGGLVAQAGVLAALQSAGVRLSGDLLFESVVDEEWGGGGGSLAARLRGGHADACVVAEGTQLQVFRATRGGFVVDLLLSAGDPESYFSDAEVVSPAGHVGKLLGWVEMWRKRRSLVVGLGAYSEFSDPAPVQILAIEANRLERDVPLSVPLAAGVRLYFQFLPSENPIAVLDEVQASLREFEKGDEFFRSHPTSWKPLYDPPLWGHEVAADHAFVRTLVESGTDVIGSEPLLTAAPYPCDAFLMDREFGIPTVLFGPCGGGAHNANEYVDFPSVITATEVLLAAALRWCDGA